MGVRAPDDNGSLTNKEMLLIDVPEAAASAECCLIY